DQLQPEPRRLDGISYCHPRMLQNATASCRPARGAGFKRPRGLKRRATCPERRVARAWNAALANCLYASAHRRDWIRLSVAPSGFRWEGAPENCLVRQIGALADGPAGGESVSGDVNSADDI